MIRLLVIVLLLSLASAAMSADAPRKLDVQKKEFGKMPDGTVIDVYTLTNTNGMVARVINYGALLTELHVPDKNGKTVDVVLGFDDLKGYLGEHPYFGANCGRVANRIAKAKFTLDGKEYTLAANNGPNHLHGGKKAFDKVVWKGHEPVIGAAGVGVSFTYKSPDGEEGYPGNLDVRVTYLLTENNELSVLYHAETDKATPINMAHHSYFNLSGSGDILDHELLIRADKYTPTDATLIPTGKIEPVKDTPLDFTKETAIGKRIKDIKAEPVGYDHNYVLNPGPGATNQAAWVKDPKSGRIMEVETTEPGLQLYTGNFLDGKVKGKGGVAYQKHAAFCLEAQHFPDAVNQKDFPSVILKPGKMYDQRTTYKFSAQ
jgi:aldose 1-epimerase